MPYNIPFEAKKSLILKSVSLWKAPTVACFSGVCDNLSEILCAFLEEHFGRFKQLQSYMEYEVLSRSAFCSSHFIIIRLLTKKEVDECREAALKALLKTLELEKMPLFTQNTEFLGSEREKWLGRYQYKHRWPYPRSVSPESRAQSPPTPTPTSSFDEEMVVMAEVRAYFEVAYRVRSSLDYCSYALEH